MLKFEIWAWISYSKLGGWKKELLRPDGKVKDGYRAQDATIGIDQYKIAKHKDNQIRSLTIELKKP